MLKIYSKTYKVNTKITENKITDNCGVSALS